LREPMVSEPERARRILRDGVLVFRWASLVWMAVANTIARDSLRYPILAWLAIALTAAWTVWLTIEREPSDASLVADLALSMGLIVLSGLVVERTAIVSGRLFFATTYPASTALAWGATRGRAAGIAAGLGLSVALVFSRLANGVNPFASSNQLLGLLNGMVYYVLAGGAAGVVARTLDRSAVQLRRVIDDLVRTREEAARRAAWESFAGAIHDSVLQALAWIHRQGRELAAEGNPSREQVRRLAEIAGEEERALRGFILGKGQDSKPLETKSLQQALGTTAARVPSVRVEASSSGPLVLPARVVDEIVLAVTQALNNVAEHARSDHAYLSAELAEGQILVSVRDDGGGFDLDAIGPDSVGIRTSIIGRIEALGGSVRIETAPGKGCIVLMRIPVTGGGALPSVPSRR
jgi:signal transduction histidine kinase